VARGPLDGQSGSALVLVPALVLVVALLAALVVDSAGVWLGQRQLQAAAQTAATDAVSALSQSAFYTAGAVELDPAAATSAALDSLGTAEWSGVKLLGSPVIEVAGRSVCVRLVGAVHPVIGPDLPGLGAASTVTATARATATPVGVPPPAGAGPTGGPGC
jgi:uncharacterized membrane protein